MFFISCFTLKKLKVVELMSVPTQESQRGTLISGSTGKAKP